MSMLQNIKQAALKDLLQNEWTTSDREIKTLTKAKDLEEVWWALYYVAEHIGSRKGWGEEGIGDLHYELVEKYWGEYPIPEF